MIESLRHAIEPTRSTIAKYKLPCSINLLATRHERHRAV